MKVRFQAFWDSALSSYWFVPTLMAALAIGLSFLTIYIDRTYRVETIRELGYVWTGGPEGARALLSSVGSSMITVASLTFSVTIVALALASSQFGPRLLRNFMRDTGNQVVLGTFIATFIYCLLILRTVHSGEVEFVPQLSVTVSLLLALASLGVLIYYIHHIALSIQAPNVIAEVAEELFATIDRIFPGEIGLSPEEAGQPGDPPATGMPAQLDEPAEEVLARGAGYLQAIDNDALLHVAARKDLILRIRHRPGEFISYRHTLVDAFPARRVEPDIVEEIRSAFIIGWNRTPTQDVGFAIDQLVEVAVRALSAAYNDPFTAINCIDWLGAALIRLAKKPFPSPYRYDNSHNLRIIAANPLNFPDLVDETFDQIRQYAESSVAVRLRLLEVIAVVARNTPHEENRQALLRQARMIRRGSAEELHEREDLAEVEERYRNLTDK
ncbi:MAG: DUF2254 domain-containing protein [Chloroflexota bacterium]|nr:MAG: DUF2254 domain-containing protein [Chloroflexota bacterium]